jgi:hypothetical protein
MSDTTSARGLKLVEKRTGCIATLDRWFKESQTRLQAEDLSDEERDCHLRFERLEQLGNVLKEHVRCIEEARRNSELYTLEKAKERDQFLELRLEEVNQLIKWHDKLLEEEADVGIVQLKLGRKLRYDLVKIGEAKEENYAAMVRWETDEERRNQYKSDEFLLMLGLSFAKEELKAYEVKLEQKVLAGSNSN